jgi:hypothetical protein
MDWRTVACNARVYLCTTTASSGEKGKKGMTTETRPESGFCISCQLEWKLVTVGIIGQGKKRG